MAEKPTIAAFDFDGTLTRSDSLVPFLLFTFGYWKTVTGLFLELPAMMAFLVHLKSRQETKERLLTRFLKGISQTQLQEMGRQFALQKIDSLLKDSSLELVRWHQQQGHTCLLISASINIYLEPWAHAKGFKYLLSSQLDYAEGLATGKLQGLNCWGKEKERRLLELLGPRENFVLYAYGDSRGDEELLAMADFARRL